MTMIGSLGARLLHVGKHIDAPVAERRADLLPSRFQDLTVQNGTGTGNFPSTNRPKPKKPGLIAALFATVLGGGIAQNHYQNLRVAEARQSAKTDNDLLRHQLQSQDASWQAEKERLELNLSSTIATINDVSEDVITQKKQTAQLEAKRQELEVRIGKQREHIEQLESRPSDEASRVALFQKIGPAVPRIVVYNGSSYPLETTGGGVYFPGSSLGYGSGVVIQDKNNTCYVITNAHVLEMKDIPPESLKQIKFRFDFYDPATSKVVASITAPPVHLSNLASRAFSSSEYDDFAVFKLDDSVTLPTNVNPIELADCNTVLHSGDSVYAIGHPRQSFGMAEGIINSPFLIRSDFGGTRLTPYIKTSAAINQGNSGGALVNSRGQLIGINTLIKPDSNPWNGAIRFDWIKDYLEAMDVPVMSRLPNPKTGLSEYDTRTKAISNLKGEVLRRDLNTFLYGTDTPSKRGLLTPLMESKVKKKWDQTFYLPNGVAKPFSQIFREQVFEGSPLKTLPAASVTQPVVSTTQPNKPKLDVLDFIQWPFNNSKN